MAFPESEFVKELVPDPCDVPKLVVVVGFYKEHPAPAAGKQKCRVYLNHVMTDYYEYEDVNDIQYVDNIVDSDRQRVWVRHGAPARIVRTRAFDAQVEPLLEGPIARTFLPPQAAAAAPVAPQPWPQVQYAQYYGFPQAGIDWPGFDDGFQGPSACAKCGSGSP
jgi:hypothetical protein